MSGTLLSLEFDQTAITLVRRLVRQSAAEAGLADEALEDFVLAVHEAVTNAIKYGTGPRSLTILEDSGLFTCEVRDCGPGIPPRILRPDSPTGRLLLGGRGLWLMRNLAQTSIQTGPEGTAVRLAAAPP